MRGIPYRLVWRAASRPRATRSAAFAAPLRLAPFFAAAAARGLRRPAAAPALRGLGSGSGLLLRRLDAVPLAGERPAFAARVRGGGATEEANAEAAGAASEAEACPRGASSAGVTGTAGYRAGLRRLGAGA